MAHMDSASMLSNRVSLAHIIDLGVQRTYTELTHLAELLPRKTDLERKIEIVNFVSRTRMIFIRILALVKWASGASKVEQCMDIVAFLDKQALLFINTADNLVNIARTTLVQARLPSFQLPCAVEVLTLGTYSKMPTCIRDRIVPPDPISPEAKRNTLLKLNHIIEQKLSVSNLPARLRNLTIEHGRVTFHVPNEFNLTLTLLGDSQNLPWKVLKVEILVQDRDTGDGKDLVHLAHINAIQHLLQSRINEHPNPLVECHNLLRSFCLSLQIEVLHDQMERLLRDRLAGYIRIIEHVPGSKLAISYWKARGFTLRIETDQNDPTKPLKLIHQPELSPSEGALEEMPFTPNQISIERLITETTHRRAAYKLSRVADEIRERNLGTCKLVGTPAMLHVSYLEPCRPSEMLIIAVDALNGSFLVHIPQYENCPIAENIQETLNTNRSTLQLYFNQLRIWLTKKRCNKTIEYLSITVSENLPLCTKANQPRLDDKIPRLFFQFNKYSQHYLMAEFFNSDIDPNRVNIRHYLLSTETMTGDSIDRELFPDMPVESLQRDLIVVENLMELAVPTIISSSYCYESPSRDTSDPTLLHINGVAVCRLGKLRMIDNNNRSSLFTTLSGVKRFKRLVPPAYHIPELPHIIGFCEEKLAYTLVSAELKKRDINHKVIRSASSASAHHIVLSQFPPNSSHFYGVSEALQNDTLSATMSVQEKNSKLWVTSFIFQNCPVVSQSYKEQGPRRIFCMTYDAPLTNQKQVSKFLDDTLQDWSCMAHLYDIVKQFSVDLKRNPWLLNQMCIRTYNYRKISIGYGPRKQYSVSIVWRSLDRKFQLLFGVVGGPPFSANPHSTMALYFKHDFNQHLSIATLVQNLNVTLASLDAIHNCMSLPLPGKTSGRPVLSYCLVPLSTSHIRLVYRNMYCFDIIIRCDGTLTIRDGANSRFDNAKTIEELTPTQNLKSVLNSLAEGDPAIKALLMQCRKMQ